MDVSHRGNYPTNLCGWGETPDNLFGLWTGGVSRFEPDRAGGGEAKEWGSGLGQCRGLAATMGMTALDFESDENQGAKVNSRSTAVTSGPVATALSVPLRPDSTLGNSTLGSSALGPSSLQGSSPPESL